MPLPRILDLYDPENLPNRALERTIQPDDPSTVYRDIQDYVLPPEVKEWLFDRPDSLVGQYLGSHSGVPDATCTWITGFFGSGKSHLLKVLAYLLSNKEVTDDAGHTFGATRFICDRLGRGEPRDPHHQPVLRPSLDRPDARLCPGQLADRPGILDQLHHPELARTFSGSITSALDRPVRAVASKEQSVRELFARSWPRRRPATVIPGSGPRFATTRRSPMPLLVQGLLKFLPQDSQVARIGRGFCSAGRAEEIRARGSCAATCQRSEGHSSPEGSIARLPRRGTTLPGRQHGPDHRASGPGREGEVGRAWQGLSDRHRPGSPGRCRQSIPSARCGYRDPRGSLS